MRVQLRLKQLGMAFSIALLAACGGGSSDDDSAATAPAGGGTPPASSTPDAATTTGDTSTAVAKASTLLSVTGSLSLTTGATLALTDSDLNLTAVTSIKCVDAIDGTEYATGVAVGTDGSFDCGATVPQCYDADSCADANPVQVNLIDEATGNTICVATAGSAGLVCDSAGCFAAAQSALGEDVKQCLTSVNMVAASNVFQSALNKANKMGEIALDEYTLEECLAMTAEQKLTALQGLTRGSLAEVLINTLDQQLQKEINKCDSTKGSARTLRSALADLTTMGFGVLLSGTAYDADAAVPGSVADQLVGIANEIKAVRIEVANGRDPYDLVTAGSIQESTLTYRLSLKCMYRATDGEGEVTADLPLNAGKTDWGTCPATKSTKVYSQGQESLQELPLSSLVLTTNLKFPDINDPQGVHNNRDDSAIPFEYGAFKKIIENVTKLYSLQDVHNIFFASDSGLKFRLNTEYYDDQTQTSQSFVIGPDNTAHVLNYEDPTAFETFKAATYAPSFAQVFDFITNDTHAFDLDRLLRTKVHRRWNPTGQEHFYVFGKEVNNKEIPVTCDILKADGTPAGLDIRSGVTVTCVTTDVTADMKKFFIDGTGNPAFLRVINKDNGNEVRSADDSPIYLQAINVSPGQNMATCTTANQFSILKYQSQGEHDQYLNERDIRTICVDFSTLKNDAEYYMPYQNSDTKIGQNSEPSRLLAGRDPDGNEVALCLGSGTITLSDSVGCLNYSTGVFTACANQSDCECNWQNGEDKREFSTLTAPEADSLTLGECSSSSTYYFEPHWEPGSRTSEASLKVRLIDGTSGDSIRAYNSSYDPNVVGTYIETAFAACKDSQWCWMKDQISEYTAHTDMPSNEPWMKSSVVQWYCGENFDDDTIRTNCNKLNPEEDVTIPLTAFSNASNTASSSGDSVTYEVFRNESYFSHMKQPNPNYNRVFDFETFTFKYDNYDPFCDDVNDDGKCSIAEINGAKDVFLSDIWRFNPSYVKFSPVALDGFTHDSSNSLFPAAPTDWSGDAWRTYVQPVYNKIGGPSALACVNDRSIKLSWDSIQVWENQLWTDAQTDTCGADNGYLIVRNIVPNKNTYMVGQADYIQAMMRIAFGTVNKRSLDPAAKNLDFIQAMAVFMIPMEIPPIIVQEDGSYQPFYPTINGKVKRDGWAGYQPFDYTGSLEGIIDLFIAIPEE